MYSFKSFIPSFLLFLVVAVLNIGDFIDEPFPEFFYSILLMGMFITHLLFFNNYTRKKTVYNVEQLFSKLIYIGIFILLINLIPDLFNIISTNWMSNYPRLGIAIDLLGFYATFNYLLYSLSMYKKLIFVEASPNTLRRWQLFMLTLGVSSFSSFVVFELPLFFISIILLSGWILILSLITRINWIAILNVRVKWLSIWYLIILVLICLVLIQKAYFADIPYVINFKDPIRNAFLILVVSLILVYNLLSILALFFSIPITNTIEKRLEAVRSFQDIGSAINRRDSIGETLQLLFKVCYNNTSSNAGWLMAVAPSHNEKTYISEGISKTEIEWFKTKINFVDLMGQETLKEYYYYPDLAEIQMTDADEFSFRSMLVIPIFNGDVLYGVINLLKDIPGGFDEYMIELTSSYVKQANVAFENMGLMEESIANARMQEQLEIAKGIQKRLLPQNFPESIYYEIAAYSDAAYEIGGDYYDFVEQDKDKISVVMGDVAGSGTSAAFYMAEFKGIVQSLLLLDFTVKQFLIQANKAVSQCLERNTFITFSYLQFNFTKNVLTYGRAGHTPVLYFENESKKAYFLNDEGLGLGIIRDDSYENFVQIYERNFEVDDIIVLFTDGITEARHPQTDEEYGQERLRRCIENNHDFDANDLKITLLNDLKKFAQEDIQNDDHSLIIIKIR